MIHEEIILCEGNTFVMDYELYTFVFFFKYKQDFLHLIISL